VTDIELVLFRQKSCYSQGLNPILSSISVFVLNKCSCAFTIEVEFVPILGQIDSRTLDFRESKCLFRGPEILMGTNNYKHLW